MQQHGTKCRLIDAKCLQILSQTVGGISSKFVNKFLSYPADRQTEKQHVKHVLLGGGNYIRQLRIPSESRGDESRCRGAAGGDIKKRGNEDLLL